MGKPYLLILKPRTKIKLIFFERLVLSFLLSLISKLIKGIIESLKIKFKTGNYLRSSIKRLAFAGPRLDVELSTNQKCLQLNLGVTQP